MLLFLMVVALDLGLAVIYKLSQNREGEYDYDPPAALVIVSLLKCLVSALLLCRQEGWNHIQVGPSPSSYHTTPSPHLRCTCVPYAIHPSIPQSIRPSIHPSIHPSSIPQAWKRGRREMSLSAGLLTGVVAVAGMECAAGYLLFWLFQLADPSTINVAKSAVPILSAAILHTLARYTLEELNRVPIHRKCSDKPPRGAYCFDPSRILWNAKS